MVSGIFTTKFGSIQHTFDRLTDTRQAVAVVNLVVVPLQVSFHEK